MNAVDLDRIMMDAGFDVTRHALDLTPVKLPGMPHVNARYPHSRDEIQVWALKKMYKKHMCIHVRSRFRSTVGLCGCR